MAENFGYSLKKINTILQNKSGMLGLTGQSDLREVQTLSDRGDKNAKLALFMNAYRIKKYIGSYTAIMNGLDAIVFTAGIGENSIEMRQLVCNELDYLGIALDEKKNNIRPNKLADVSSENSKVKVLIIPTNEELEIAKQSVALFKN
jgi:acetate kinase